MFGRWKKTTLEEGATGQGTVVNAVHFDLTVYSRGFQETFKLRRAIRVSFTDGSTAEATCDVTLRQVQKLAGDRTIDCWPRLPRRTRVGATVPVRYDEWDHSRIVLDLPALIAEMLAQTDAATGLSGSGDPPL
jgi:hypothetical protein